MSGGRPDEGRVRIVAHVLPETADKITALVDKSEPNANTIGKVIDAKFGVRRRKKIPSGRRGRGAR